jgi:hypothetical protein
MTVVVDKGDDVFDGAAGPYGAALADYAGPIDATTLMTEAKHATGLSDWGGRRWDEERFRHDFAILCESIEATADLSAIGRGRMRRPCRSPFPIGDRMRGAGSMPTSCTIRA